MMAITTMQYVGKIDASHLRNNNRCNRFKKLSELTVPTQDTQKLLLFKIFSNIVLLITFWDETFICGFERFS